MDSIKISESFHNFVYGKYGLLWLMKKIYGIKDSKNTMGEQEQRHDYLDKFIKDAFPNNKIEDPYKINGKKYDTVILDHNHKVRVIFEYKTLSSRFLVTLDHIRNQKQYLHMLSGQAFQEAINYYLIEKAGIYKNHKFTANHEPIMLIITDGLEWFIISNDEAYRLFYCNQALYDTFTSYNGFGQGSNSNRNKDFYPHLSDTIQSTLLDNELMIGYYDARSLLYYNKYNKKKQHRIYGKLVAFYQFLSPQNLLGQDIYLKPNYITNAFYSELLYIMGLQDSNEHNRKNNKNNISPIPKTSEKYHRESIINLIYDQMRDYLKNNYSNKELIKQNKFTDENHINKLKYLDDAINIAVTFIDRLLFLKLLEGQLIQVHNNEHYEFMDSNHIKNFNDLSILFFQVMNSHNRSKYSKYRNVPYLNSSLFSKTYIENKYDISISKFHDAVVPLMTKSKARRVITTSCPTLLQYILGFLKSYCFRANGYVTSKNKRPYIINDSILGSVFEKINGYKEGSYYTPSFVTDYMAKVSIKKALTNKFKQYGIDSITDAKRWMGRNPLRIINILKNFRIVDPAVGSGHFLVSALNYLIIIYYDLHIYSKSNHISTDFGPYKPIIFNSQLILYNKFFPKGRRIFKYIPNEYDDIQKHLFMLKVFIIENNLFGVDINPSSVDITKLRLWIELLKSSYYKSNNKMETMPNLEMNIKTGNSLVFHASLKSDLQRCLKDTNISMKNLKNYISQYQKTNDNSRERKLMGIISNNIIRLKLQIILQQLKQNNQQMNLFPKANGSIIKRSKLIEDKINKVNNIEVEVKGLSYVSSNNLRNRLLNEINDKINHLNVYHGFEWRYEFPQLLSNTGKLNKFDVVITNPPYIGMTNMKSQFKEIRETELGKSYSQYHDLMGKQFNDGRLNIFYYFIYLSIKLLNSKTGVLMFIITNYWLTNDYAEKIRTILRDKTNILKIINFNNLKIFKDAVGQQDLIIEAELNNCDKTEIINTNRSGSITSNIFMNIVSHKDKKYTHYTNVNTKMLYDTHNKNNIILSAGINNKLNIIINKLRQYKSLNNYIDSGYGLQPSPNKSFIIPKRKFKLFKKQINSYELSLMKPLLNGSSINRYFESNNQFDSYVMYINRDKDMNNIPNLKKYIYSHNPDVLKGINVDRNKIRYTLRRPANIHVLQSPFTLFVPHLSRFPFFMMNNNRYLIKTDSYEVHVLDKYHNNIRLYTKILLVLLNSTLCYFLWLYYNITKGTEIKIRKSSFNILPMPNISNINIKKLNDVINIMKKYRNKSIQSKIDNIVNKWFALSHKDVNMIKYYVNNNES